MVWGELRRSLDDFEEAKKWKEIEEIHRHGGSWRSITNNSRRKLKGFGGRRFRKRGKWRGSEFKPDTAGSKGRKFGEC